MRVLFSGTLAWLFDGVGGAAALALIGLVWKWFKPKKEQPAATTGLTAQGARVTDSPVASGTGITQTVNSPTFNLSLPLSAHAAPGNERYNEWRELTNELHEGFRVMAKAFAYRPPPGIIDVDEREDYHDGIQRGYRVLRNRIVIGDVLKKAGMLEKFQKIVEYAVSADTPRDASQRGCPTLTGFDMQASKFEDELMELARMDSGLLANRELRVTNTPERVQRSPTSAAPNIEYAGCKEKRVFISPLARDGICEPRTAEEYKDSVDAFVLRFENRPLAERKIERAMNVIAKLRFQSDDKATERRINYGVWLNSPCNSTTIGIGDTCELVLMLMENQPVTFEDKRADGHSFQSNYSYFEHETIGDLRNVEIVVIEKNSQTTFKFNFKVWHDGSHFCISLST